MAKNHSPDKSSNLFLCLYEDMIPSIEMLEACGVLRREKPEERSGSGRKPATKIVFNPKVREEAEE